MKNLIPALGALLVLVGLTACESKQPGTDAEDETNPYFRSAARYVSEEQYAEAINQYSTALEVNPEVQRANVEIGLLYSEKLGDPVSAIYHFQRYLKARPLAQDIDQVRNYLQKAQVDYLTSLKNSPVANREEVAQIRRENMDLNQRLSDLQAENAKLKQTVAKLETKLQNPAAFSPPTPAKVTEKKPEKPSKPPVKAPTNRTPDRTPTAPAPPSPNQDPKTYVVQKGDTLWKIAKTYFPKDITGGIKKIQEANTVTNVKNLQPGQKLIIPQE